MVFYKVDSVAPVTEYLTKVISGQLAKNIKVLWLVTGGSAIPIAASTSKLLKEGDLSRLTVTLTDERFVPSGHPDSNWQQLQDAAFDLPKAQLYPILRGEDINKTTNYYDSVLKKCFDETDYKIGLFGMGPDGHIAALFPGFPQLKEDKLYATSLINSPKPPPTRMTITIPAIKKLDEAVIFVKGEEKKAMVEKLSQDLEFNEQPAQILKNLPKLTIFNDYKGKTI